MDLPLEIHPYNRFELEEPEAMAKKKETSGKEETFGRRLARLRKEAGYSQRSLATEIGISYRMVAYYEAQTATLPPATTLESLADALGLSVDQLLGRKPVTARRAPENQRLLREFRRVEKLPARARRAVLETIDGLVAKYGAGG